MVDNRSPKGPIVMWTDFGSEGWQPKDFQTVQEALEAERYGQGFVITRLATYEVKETETES
jgi:hypothetical protein